MGQTEDKPAKAGGAGASNGVRNGDIHGAEIGKIDWADRRAALETILAEVRDKAGKSEAWYRDKKTSKAKWAVVLRVGAIVAGILSGLWPVTFNALAVIFPPTYGSIDFKNFLPLSAVFVILATGFISLDAFFGFSSGWIRYVVTFQNIQSLRETFELSWPRAALRFPKEGDIPDDVLLGALDVMLAFTKSLNDTIRDETQAWASDFREALKGMGDTIEKQRTLAAVYAAIAERGAVTVTLVGVERLEGQRWTLDVGGVVREVVGSATGTATGLSPGIAVLRARGKLDGVEASIEKTITVEAGKSVDVSLSLASPLPPATGVLLVIATGADSLEEHAWQLTITGRDPLTVRGASTEVVERLVPGLVTVRASGTRGGKPVSAAGTAVIEAGKSASLSLSFG